MNVRLALMSAGIMGADHACIFAAEIPGATLHFICDADQFRAPLTLACIAAGEPVLCEKPLS
jgi:myo-inositol 2-dehydrogenase / D-chiro-inositol 1-dehydrogenase